MKNKLTKKLSIGIALSLFSFLIFLQIVAQKNNRADYLVENLNGEKIQISKLSEKPKWLLIYIHKDAAFSMRLLETFKKDNFLPVLDKKLIVVVGGANKKQIEELAKKADWIPNSSWYSDEPLETLKNFEIKTLPLTIAMHGNKEKWRYSGSIERDSPQEKSLVSWLIEEDDVKQMQIEKENNQQK